MKPRNAPGASSRSTALRWHAVTIVAKPRSCRDAKALRATRFLSKDAPRLPLATCTARDCECTYKHFADRRSQPRRDEERLGLRKPRAAQAERRASRGRRKSDI